MTEVLKFSGIAIAAAAIILIIKQIKPELAMPVTLTVSVAGLAVSLSLFKPAIESMTELAANTMYGEYIGVLLKSLGIGLAAQTSADICRDAGESAIAAKIELIAKAEMLFISLPLLKNIITLTGEVLYR